MEKFHLSFKNKQVRMWFFIVIPGIPLTLLLYLFLPREFHLIPSLLPIPLILIYLGWLIVDRNKQK